MAEVSVVATPEELRLIARFLEACAADIEAEGAGWSHAHLGGKVCGFGDGPQLIVANPLNQAPPSAI